MKSFFISAWETSGDWSVRFRGDDDGPLACFCVLACKLGQNRDFSVLHKIIDDVALGCLCIKECK